MFKKYRMFCITVLLVFGLGIIFPSSLIVASVGYEFQVDTSFSPQRLVPNQMLTAKVVATNISQESYTGTRDVLVIVGLYDSNNTMINVSYISKGILYRGTETLSAGFKLPANVTGYTARAFMWDGTDLKTSNMIPLSNVVSIGTDIIPTVIPSITPTATPSVSPKPTPTITPTVTPTKTPSSTPTVIPTPMSDSLLHTNGRLFGRSGTAVNSGQLNNAATLAAIKNQYNSITMENEMKPDSILGSSARLMSVSQAKSNGYFISSNYTESNVPTLNFGTVDSVMKICYNNGLKLRAHTLVWHAQTPDWFFRTGYSSSGAYVSQAVMDARLEMYVKSYMSHVYSSTYGSVVYAWDVANEYLHAGSNGGWAKVYGSNLGTSPSYVKKAFQYAHDCLDSFGLTNSVSLFYNDYNEYQVTDDIVSLIKFINSGTKLCSGVGMQSHLDTSYPSASLYKSALQKFMNAGFEIQITELDVTNTSDSVQATYVYDLMSTIISMKKAGANITGITWWGLYDSISWRASNKPLLFSALNTPKASYNKSLQAFKDAGY